MMLTIPEAILILIITLLVVGLNKLQTIGKAIARLRTEYDSDNDARADSPSENP